MPGNHKLLTASIPYVARSDFKRAFHRCYHVEAVIHDNFQMPGPSSTPDWGLDGRYGRHYVPGLEKHSKEQAKR
jgi:hypothetical protein